MVRAIVERYIERIISWLDSLPLGISLPLLVGLPFSVGYGAAWWLDLSWPLRVLAGCVTLTVPAMVLKRRSAESDDGGHP